MKETIVQKEMRLANIPHKSPKRLDMMINVQSIAFAATDDEDWHVFNLTTRPPERPVQTSLQLSRVPQA